MRVQLYFAIKKREYVLYDNTGVGVGGDDDTEQNKIIKINTETYSIGFYVPQVLDLNILCHHHRQSFHLAA